MEDKEKIYLDRLREYHSYLESSQKSYEKISQEESLLGFISTDKEATSYRNAKLKLEELFPELLLEGRKIKWHRD